jgi:4'-phosphopantetheinyl transferase
LHSAQHISPQLVLGFLDLTAFSVKNGLQNKREIEKKGAAYLLSELLKKDDLSLNYDAYGKPFLDGVNYEISLSHSHQWLLAAVHESEAVGVDIELEKDKIKTIAPRFLSDMECMESGMDTNALTVYWAVKEAVYKAYGKKQVNFKEQIAVEPFELQEQGEVSASLILPNETKKYRLMYKKHHHYWFALTLHEIR